MTQINQKLKIPINWDKILIFSSFGIGAMLLLGLIFKIRVLLVLAEFVSFFFIFGLLCVAASALVHKFSIKEDENSKS